MKLPGAFFCPQKLERAELVPPPSVSETEASEMPTAA